MADRYGVDRTRQDEFALASHQKAGCGGGGGPVLAGEIIPVAQVDGR